MHGPINVKSPNNARKWQMAFKSAFKGLTTTQHKHHSYKILYYITCIQDVTFFVEVQGKVAPLISLNFSLATENWTIFAKLC
jgi:hypothetical protein